MGHSQLVGGGSGRQLSCLPPGLQNWELWRANHGFSAKFDALSLGGGNPLGLTLVYKFPLGLGDIRQQLQNNVRDQRPGQILCLPGIQQGHIQHDDAGALFPW